MQSLIEAHSVDDASTDQACPVRYMDESLKAALVRSHMEVLPESVLAWLGPRVLGCFYEFIVASERDALFIRSASAGGLGVAVASTRTQDLNARFIARHPIAFGFAAVRACASDRRMRRLLNLKLAGARDAVPAGLPTAELVHIYVSGREQARGLGRLLVSDVRVWFRAQGHARFFVKTAAAPTNRAIGFYQRLGFAEVGAGSFKGLPYVWFSDTRL